MWNTYACNKIKKNTTLEECYYNDFIDIIFLLNYLIIWLSNL